MTRPLPTGTYRRYRPDEAIEDVALDGTSHRARNLWDAANGGQRYSLTTREAQTLAGCVGLEDV